MTMRIAIAGGGGFAFILAGEIAQSTNAVLVLSTRQHPEFEQLGVQVAVVDYSNVQALQYTLRGVDLLISTIPGESQLNLIDAARRARVHTFVPSEFEGAIGHRPTSTDDALDRGSAATLRLLREWSQSSTTTTPITATTTTSTTSSFSFSSSSNNSSSGGSNNNNTYTLRYTVFTCGIFYERFHPGGLAFFNIGAGTNVQHPGDYLVNVNAATAEIVELSAQGRPAAISMTSVYDVARFMAAAIEIGPEHWPRELRMRGDQLTVVDVVRACSTAREVPFNLVNHEYRNIQAHLDYAIDTGDINRWYYFQRLRATAEGRYTFGRANLNELVDQAEGIFITPLRFVDWLRRVYTQA